MGKKLVIVESPAKAKTIVKYLGKGYDVKASFGHVRDLPAYKLGVDLEQNFEPSYVAIKDKAKVIKELKSLAKKADEVILATDPDREGEAIAWHIKEAVDVPDEKVSRVIFNEITKKAIQSAIDHPRKIDSDLVDAQQARRVLDRLIGYKLSPILSKKIRKGLSAGRVQSVAVKLICDREAEITAFTPEEYWVIEVDLKNKDDVPFRSKLISKLPEEDKLHIPNEAASSEIVSALKDASYSVRSLKVSRSKRNPYPPFITSTLQQEASRKLHWSAKKTMIVAQKLYEGVNIDGEHLGLITYMRTDSVRISAEAQGAARDYITSNFGSNYLPPKPRDYQKKGSRIQDAHEAIRPSYVDRSPKSLEGLLDIDEQKLYQLVWDRFMASQMASAELENTQATIEANSYLFRSTGHVVIFDGFMHLHTETKDVGEDDDQDQSLPKLSEGEALKFTDLNNTQKFTQPPPRYSEARLVREMEEKGIGRPSTYAPTISVIQDRGYVDKQNRTLFPTELGIIVNTQLNQFFETILDLNFTADMETQLDDIMHGDHKWQTVIQQFFDPFSQLVIKADEGMEKINMDKPSDEICDKCNKPMVIKTGRYGEFLACTGFPDCKNAKPIIHPIGVKCPECQSDLIEKKSKRGKVFYGCSAFPKCKFASWDKPVDQTCPDCQTPIMYSKKKNDDEVIYCAKCSPPPEKKSKSK